MSFFGVFVIMAEKRVKGRIFTEDRLGFLEYERCNLLDISPAESSLLPEGIRSEQGCGDEDRAAPVWSPQCETEGVPRVWLGR